MDRKRKKNFKQKRHGKNRKGRYVSFWFMFSPNECEFFYKRVIATNPCGSATTTIDA